MKNLLLAAAAALSLTLAGCAAAPVQKPVAYAPKPQAQNLGSVAVAMTPLPKVNTFFPGANCLLCLAAAELNHKSLTSHTQALSVEELRSLKTEVAALLEKQGYKVKIVSEPIDLSRMPKSRNANGPARNLTNFKAIHGTDKMLLIDVTALGIVRNYAAFVPNGEPKAIVGGSAYLVDLSNNTYEWFTPIDSVRAAEGPWDEAPRFPGLTNAYFQAVETARDSVLKPFATTAARPAPVASAAP